MRRGVVLGILLVAGALSMTAAAYQQRAAAQPRVVEVDKIKDNLYVMRGSGGNSAVFIAADGVTVVDTKNPGWGQPLLDAIKGITDKPVTRIVNTHTHPKAASATASAIDTIINGHNPTPTTMADLRLQAEFIAEFVKFVQEAKKSGKTVDEVVNTWKTPERFANYATPSAARVRADAQVVWDETK